MHRLTHISCTVFTVLAVSGCTPKQQDGGPSPSAANSHRGPHCAAGFDAQPDAVVATYDGTPVRCSEVASQAQTALAQADAEYREKVHTIMSRSLELLVDERLVKQQAEKANQSPEEFLAARVGTTEPTEEEIRQVYDVAKSEGTPIPEYEVARPQIKEFLAQRMQQGKLAEVYTALRSEAKVELSLPPYLPPKVEVNAAGPSKGPADAPVTIVEFSDFECPFCGRVEPTIAQVMQDYAGKVRLVYKDYPLPNHSQAPKAAEAALCAGDQDKYWEMHATLFENQTALAIADLKRHAKSVGLDAAAFDTCLDSGKHANTVASSAKLGESLGVTGTPAFFINGRLLSGAQPYERFKALIDHELHTAGAK